MRQQALSLTLRRHCRGLGILAAVWFALVVPLAPSHAQGRPETQWIKTTFISSVSQTAVSPDGQFLAAAGDSRIDLYRLSDGTCLRTLTTRGSAAHTVAWSPDGTKIASTGYNGQVWLFRAADGVLLARAMTNHSGHAALSLAFSPDGQHVITATPSSATLDIWRASNLTLSRRMAAVGARCVAYSPDGSTLAVGYEDRRIRILDATTGVTVRTLTGHTGRVNDVAFSPDGTMLVSGSDDKTGRIWEVATGASLAVLSGHPWPVDEVDFAPDGLRVATAGSEQLSVWTAPGGLLVQTIAAGGICDAVCFAPGGATVISGFQMSQLAEWNIVSGTQVREFTVGDWSANVIAMDPTGSRVASAGRTIQIYRASDGHLLADIGALSAWPVALAWSPDGSVIHVVHNNAVDSWDTVSGSNVGQFTFVEPNTFVVSIAADGSNVALTDQSGTLAAYDVATGTRLWGAPGLQAWAIDVSADGSEVAALLDGATLDVRNMANGAPLLSVPIDPGYGYANAVAFSPDGSRVAIGTMFGYALIVERASGTIVPYLSRPFGQVQGVAFSHDGLKLIVGSATWESDAAQVVRVSDGRILLMYGEEMNRGISRACTSPAAPQWCYARNDGAVVMAEIPDTSDDALLDLQDASGEIGTPVELVAALRINADMGPPLAGREVHFWRDGPWWGPGYIGSAVTDANGEARLTYIVEAPAGSRPIYAAFSGGTGYQYVDASAWLNVLTPTTRMFMLNASGRVDSTVGIRAFLTTGASVPIPNKTVSYSLAGTTIGTAVTDIGGRATLWYVIPNTRVAGSYPISSSFAGDASYPGASAAATLTITQGAVNLWVMPRSIQRGTAAYLRAVVRSAILLTPLPDLQIGFTLEGTPLGTAVTDASGRAALLYTVPAGTSPGVLTLQCTFAGNAYYLPANGSAPITITP